VLNDQEIDPYKQSTKEHFFLFRPFVTTWQWLIPPTQAHKDRQSKAAKVTGIVTISCICFTLLGIGFFFAKPVQDFIQNIQADWLHDEAKKHLQEGELRAAFQKTQQAVLLAPENTNAVRLNAEILTAAHRTEAVYFLDKLDELGATEPNDRVTRVEAYINLQKNREAAELMQSLFKTQEPTEKLITLADKLWGKNQTCILALEPIRAYADRHPEQREHQVQLARLELNSADSAAQEVGIRRAWALTEKQDALSLRALELLNDSPNLPADESAKLIRALRQHPKHTTKHFMAAVERQQRLQPMRTRELIDEVMAYAAGKKRDDLVPILRWLNLPPQNAFQQVLSLVAEEEAVTHPILLQEYLNSLTRMGKIHEINRIVESPKLHGLIDETQLAFYRACLAFVSRKSTDECRAAMVTAKNAADIDHRIDLLIRIGQQSEQQGYKDIAADAFRSIVHQAKMNPSGSGLERQAYTGLIRSLHDAGDTEAYLATAQNASVRWADDATFQEEYAYACLLAGHHTEVALSRAIKLQELQPDNPLRHLTVALGWWRLGHPTAIKSQLQDLHINTFTAGQQAVLAALICQSKYENASILTKQLLQQIPPKAPMLPQERECFTLAAKTVESLSQSP
jgi:hypothetical protein